MGDRITGRSSPDALGRLVAIAMILMLGGIGHVRAAQRPDGRSGKKTPAAGHLSQEKSPYLIQHAGDAVDWYPWSEEAFRKAREENKPIFLSIGYSSCHWCHVMRQESFSNAAVAALLNESFVPVLVDREERPDIDSVYIAAAEVLNGSGGWPLNLMLTPERKPFYAATYIPREDLNGKPGLLRLLPQIAAAWKKNPADVARTADQIVAGMASAATGNAPVSLDSELLKEGFEDLTSRFDTVNGGFLPTPKFPSPHHYMFLLRYWKRSGDRSALDMVTKSLDSMRSGAIYDQIGSGFHRYSTDGQWRLPHFEKMLYDQALLAIAYTEAFQATGDKRYRETAEATLDYCMANLRGGSGAFYSAQDADSAAGEGAFYLWTAKELKETLGAGAQLFGEAYGVSTEGNFPGGPVPNGNLLHRLRTDEELAAEHGLAVPDVRKSLAKSEARLKTVRASRPAPPVDTKILADWNGLMIAALSQAAQVFGEPRYERAARSAAGFVLGSMEQKDGTLLHSHGKNSPGNAGTLDDYAFTIWGLLNLYETSFEVRYLQAAIRLEHFSMGHFWDEADGGFFMTGSGAEKLLARPRTVFDSDKPSGNSVQLMNLLRLARMTGDPALENRAEKLAKAFAPEVARSPGSSTFFLSALGFQLGPSFEVVIAGDASATETATMIRALRSEFIPAKVVLFRPTAANPPITTLAPFTEAQRSLRGKATAYVCTNYNCKLPTNDPEVMLRQLREK